MQIPLTVFFLIALGALIACAIVTTRREREADYTRHMTDTAGASRSQANSPYRVACSACGASVDEICKAIDGAPPAGPHTERMRALHALRRSECNTFFAALKQRSR